MTIAVDWDIKQQNEQTNKNKHARSKIPKIYIVSAAEQIDLSALYTSRSHRCCSFHKYLVGYALNLGFEYK